MKNLKEQLERQLRFNRMKNILCESSANELAFSEDTIAFFREHLTAIKEMKAEEEEVLLNYLPARVMESLCQANQFYYFNKVDRDALKKLYRKSIALIRLLPEPVAEEELQGVARQHYRALQGWLKRSNPFVKTLYPSSEPFLEQEVVCEEYSSQTQLELLGIELNTLQEPILDIGCGQQAFLVEHLRSLGLEVYGIERNLIPCSYLFHADWFEFDLSAKAWGTIISNVGFSNHFQHHHLRIDGGYTRYAVRYMEILQSLKRGGAFFYAPDLPFIEQYLDTDKFLIQKRAVEGTTFSATRVVKK